MPHFTERERRPVEVHVPRAPDDGGPPPGRADAVVEFKPASVPPARPRRRARIALAHDWLCGYRGGEAVLERIARFVVDRHEAAGLMVMVDDGRPVAPTIDVLEHITSGLQQIPFGATALRRHLLPLYPRAVDELGAALRAAHSRRAVDLLISTSSAAIKGLRAPDGVPHLCYCHSPARYIWSQRREYTRAGVLTRFGLKLMRRRFREWDRVTSLNVTAFVANSTHTASLIERAYGRDAVVIHPPVRTAFFTPDQVTSREDFWLVAGALEPYKRTEAAIFAANAAHHRLIVAGDGTQRRRLQRIAGPTVEFAGRVSDEALRDLFRRARVLLFPQVEDFGIIAVEAQACGLPVAAFGAGGALETVVDGVTGAYFQEVSPEAIMAAINRCPSGAAAAGACRRHAERFSEDRFDREFGAEIDRMLV